MARAISRRGIFAFTASATIEPTMAWALRKGTPLAREGDGKRRRHHPLDGSGLLHHHRGIEGHARTTPAVTVIGKDGVGARRTPLPCPPESPSDSSRERRW